MYRTLLVMGAAWLLAGGAARAQSVDEIIAKNIEAHGGMEKMESVKTVRVSGRLLEGGFRARFVQENKRPDKVREETIIQGLVAIEAYDGKTGWRVSPFGGRKDPVLVSADDLKGLMVDADIDGPLVNYKAKGNRAELEGHDSVEGTDCYKIKLTLKDGDVRYYYLDTDSYMEIKIEDDRTIRGTVEKSEMYFGDYEKVDGIYYSFAYEGSEVGNPRRVKYTVEKIEVNEPLADSLFEMPATAGAEGSGGAEKK